MGLSREVDNQVDRAKAQPSAAEQFLLDCQERQQRRKRGDATQAPGRAPNAGSDLGENWNSISSQNFDYPITHLNKALASLKKDGLQSQSAMSEYYAAVRAADGINQDEVKHERQNVQEKLKTTTDAAERQKLVQYDLQLHDMQRAPGFTRANLGMVLVRAGQAGKGGLLISEAGKLDPEMATDPNFIRHMKKLNSQVATDAQPGNQPAPAATGEITQTGRTGDPVTSGGTTGDNPGAGQQQQEGSPDGFRWTNDGVAGSGSTSGDTQTRPLADQPPTHDNPNATQNNQLENPVALLRTAETALGQKLQLTPEILAQYDKAITAADKVQEAMKARDAEVKKYYNKEREDKITALVTERNAAMTALQASNPNSAQELTKLAEKWAKAKENERPAIVADMAQVPGASTVLAKQSELDKAEADPNHKKYLELYGQTFAGQMETLQQLAQTTYDKPLEDKIAKLSKEHTELEAALKKEHPDDFKQFEQLEAQRQAKAVEVVQKNQAGDTAGQAKAEAEHKQIEEQMSKVSNATDLFKKEKEQEEAEADPKHVRLTEIAAAARTLKQMNDAPMMTRLSCAAAFAFNAGQIDQIVKGNLTRAERLLFAEMAGQTNLKPDQKAALSTIVDADTLTDAQRAQLKQMAADAQLTPDQKNLLTTVTAQFDLTNEQKAKLQETVQQNKAAAAKRLDEMFKMNNDVRKVTKFIKLAQEVGYQIPQ